MLPSATAVRTVIGLSLTSTMRARPAASTCESFMSAPPTDPPVRPPPAADSRCPGPARAPRARKPSPPPPSPSRRRPAPAPAAGGGRTGGRSEEHTSELQSRLHLVCRLLLEK